MTTLREKAHMGRIAQLPCVCCCSHGVEVHHIRAGDAAGAGQRSKHWLCVPLCPDCHRGTNGVHGNKSYLRIKKLTELDLLAATIEALNA